MLCSDKHYQHKFKCEQVENKTSLLLRFQVNLHMQLWLNLGSKTFVWDYAMLRSWLRSDYRLYFYVIMCNRCSVAIFLVYASVYADVTISAFELGEVL